MRSGELAKLIGVPGNTIRRLAKLGIIPAKRLATGRAHWNFATADVDAIRTKLIDAGVIEDAPPRKKRQA